MLGITVIINILYDLLNTLFSIWMPSYFIFWCYLKNKAKHNKAEIWSGRYSTNYSGIIIVSTLQIPKSGGGIPSPSPPLTLLRHNGEINIVHI